MFRQWLSGHKSLVATATSGSVVAALVAAVAIVSTGYTAQKLDLNDSSVWVANGAQQSLGRANTSINSLNTVVPTTGTELDVRQSGSTVLLIDSANSKLDIIDPATSTVSDSVPLPPGKPQVYLAGDNVVILSQTTGQVWITPLSDVTSFDSQAPEDLSLGTDLVASVDDAGQMFAYSPSSRKVSRILPADSDAVVSTDPLTGITAGDTLSISSANGRWAVLDSTDAKLHLVGKTVDLAGTDAATSGVLQQASSTGSRFLVAGSTGLVAVALDGSTRTGVLAGMTGLPAAPLVAAGCDFAAWSGGVAWRRCASDAAAGSQLTLGSMPSSPALAFRANGTRVVLNDSRAGATWAVQDQGQLINNWDELIAPKTDNTDPNTDPDTPDQVEKQQQPPVAVDDQLGARPGRSSVLPVLLNDYDPNGDVLVITDTTAIPEAVGHLDLINDRQELQLTLEPGARGVVTFRYTINDGRGGTDSALVTVTIRKASENAAPRQVRSSKSIVAEGGRVTTQVLGDWVDPDGDPIYLTDASVADPDSVSFKPQGTVVFTDAGKGGSVKPIALVVSDGKSEGTGSLAITVRAAGKVPIIADPFIVIATAGQEVTVSPLAHVRGGTGAVRLNSVPAKSGVTITPSYETGTFEFTSSQVTTHYLDYVVTDGDQSVTGVVRVDVTAPPDANTKPITIPKTIFVQTLGTASIDVADSDIDPAGGVLLVTGLTGLDTDTGVTAEILEQRVVRVRLTAPLKGPMDFNYSVSNGLAQAEGVITVVEIPVPTRLQPPIANDDSVTVRAGAAIDIPVLANDEDPDGEDLTLVPTLPQNLPSGAGLLFASGTVLRYLAPERPGNYSAVYEIKGPDGQAARAQLRIAVREADVETNNPPVPQTITARVLAGETVTIKVPLNGIDPDGDTVQLLGQETNPDKGSVVAVGSDSISYKAGDYSAGTDSFTYTVIDALGARATGTVRVGISARLDGARNPIATLDEVTVRPGVTVSVQVLANDSDPDGSPLHVVSATPNDKVTKATVAGDIVSIRPPDASGTYGVIYTIENDTGGTSSSFVRVTVDPKAPLSFPEASDTVLTLTDIVGRQAVDVDVLANVFFADGSSRSLGLSVYPGFGSTAQVTARKDIRVSVTAHSQIIPFKVTHPDDPNVFSYAFIWVPGTDDALPQLDRTAPALTVKSEDRLVIDLNDYVIAVGGKKVRLTDSGSVRATHGNGDDLVVNSTTVAFTSAPRYFGPASISFEVTDGTSATDPNGHKSILVLPITVLPRDNQPPVFAGAVLDFEPGEHKDIDLVKLTNYPYQNDLDQLVFSLGTPLPLGFTTNLVGQTLTISANDNAVKGSLTSLTMNVRDKLSVGTPGRIQLSVVPSSRPLADPAPDTAVAKRGQTTTVDVLSNDAATNPFPGQPLRVVAIRGLAGSSLPSGLSVTPSADKSTLTVTASDKAAPIDTTLQYQVADATNDPSRYVWGTIRISVQDKPEPVTAVHITDFGDRKLTVAWTSGAFNNSPITGYTVTVTSAVNNAPISKTECSGSLCSVPTGGNGPDNAVRVAVSAKNSIGSSDPTSASGSIWSDVVPSAPANLDSSPLDHGLKITWNKPADTGGSAITKYLITVEGASSVEVAVPASDPVGTSYSRSITDPSIANGSSVGFTVSARNGAFSALAVWNKGSGTGHPAGPPTRQNAPSAPSIDPDQPGQADFSWSGAFSSNGRAISDYYAAVYTGGNAPSCGVSGDVPGSPDVPADSSTFKHMGTSTSTTFTGLTTNTTYSFVVFAFNGMGCTASITQTAVPRSRPGPVSAVDVSGPESNGTNTWDFRLNDFTIGSGSTDADSFQYRLSGGDVEGGVHGPRSTGTFLETSNNSQYGQNISVQVKACRQYPEATYCSANWSPSFALGVPVQNTVLGGLTFTHDPYGTILDPATPGNWSWTSSPSGAYTSVTYDCGNGAQTLSSGEGGNCAVTDDGTPIAHHFPDLTITITANGTTYVRTYKWSDYN